MESGPSTRRGARRARARTGVRPWPYPPPSPTAPAGARHAAPAERRGRRPHPRTDHGRPGPPRRLPAARTPRPGVRHQRHARPGGPEVAAQRGFVVLEPRRGFVVAPLSKRDVQDLFWVQAASPPSWPRGPCRGSARPPCGSWTASSSGWNTPWPCAARPDGGRQPPLPPGDQPRRRIAQARLVARDGGPVRPARALRAPRPAGRASPSATTR